MPNWCQNGATFVHTDPTEIARIERAYKEDRLFSEFFPCPEELQETVAAGKVGSDDSSEQEDHIAKVQANRERHGYSDWYEWQVNEWGTKWDISSDDSEPTYKDENTITLSFNTAWSPPVKFYEKMTELGFAVTAFYLEEGMGFVGRYTSENGDEDYNFDGSEDLDDIPDDIRDYWDLDTVCDWREQEEEAND